ncbi:MAG: hypothetical protein AB7O26_13755 [Planctomycetaceae bacterium]
MSNATPTGNRMGDEAVHFVRDTVAKIKTDSCAASRYAGAELSLHVSFLFAEGFDVIDRNE